MSPEQIKVYEADCWQHLRNVWIGGAKDALEDELHDVLADDLQILPPMYRINIVIGDLFRCAEKEVGENANYAKGHGSEFKPWRHDFHEDVYFFPLARACGGTRQDICLEGAPALLMNLPYYLQFLHWRISAAGGKSDAILQTKLLIMLRSTEVVALLRVLSILYISICLPTRWLAGKSHELSEYNFGYYDMGKALDAMEKAFEAILDNGELILDKDFMMNGIFKDLIGSIDPFKEYLGFMFEEKMGNVRVGHEKVLPWDLLRAALFYPSRADIVNTDALCIQLAVVAAARFLQEFRDTSKATSQYLSSISDKYSIAVISEEQRKAGFGKEASNSISESNFASSTQTLKIYGTIRLDSAAADGLARTNNTFGRGHGRYINSGKNQDESSLEKGTLFQLPHELVTSLFHSAKTGAPRLRRRHNDALTLLNKAKLNKLRTQQLKTTQKTEEKLILALDYFERRRSERRWESCNEAKKLYEQLSSESARLSAVKEHILIQKWGWEDCGHKWSQNGHHFSSSQLLEHLIQTVIPLEEKRGIPSSAPMNVPTEVLTKYKLGTETALDYKDDRFNVKSVEEIRKDAETEYQRMKDECDTDQDFHLQPTIMPSVDNSLIDFPIEYLFQYDDKNGNPYHAWCDGVVESIHNEKTRMVVIKWNEQKVASGASLKSRHKLRLRQWNPKNPSPGAWRKFVGDPNAQY